MIVQSEETRNYLGSEYKVTVSKCILCLWEHEGVDMYDRRLAELEHRVEHLEAQPRRSGQLVFGDALGPDGGC